MSTFDRLVHSFYVMRSCGGPCRRATVLHAEDKLIDGTITVPSPKVGRAAGSPRQKRLGLYPYYHLAL